MVLAGRDPLKLHALQQTLAVAAPHVALRVVAGDLTEAGTQQEVLRQAESLGDPLDLLINAAGVNEFHPFESQPRASVERIIAINLLAPMQLTQCCCRC